MRNNSIILKVLIVYTCLVFIFLFGSYFMWNKHSRLLIENSIERRKRSELILNSTVETLSQQFINYTYDYTYWDETVSFVKNPSDEWAKINLEETMPKFNASFVWVYNPKLDLVYTHNLFNDSQYINLPIKKQILHEILSKEKFPHFFVNTNDYLFELSGAPIQLSVDSNRVGVPHGYLFNARVWNKNYIETLKQQSQSDIKLIAPADLTRFEIENNANNKPEVIYAKKGLTDYEGKVVYTLCSVFIDSSINEVKTSFTLYTLLWFICGSIILVVLLILLNLWIFNPITILTTSLSSGESKKLINLSSKPNVFGNYAKLFLDFLIQKNILREETDKRQHAEKELLIKSSAIEQSPASILIVSTNGKAEYVNPKFVETSGYTTEDLAEINLFDFLTSNKLNPSFHNITPTITAGHAWEGEVLSKKKNNELYWENILVAPIKDDDGNIVRYIVLKEDITEKKKMLDELIAAKEKAEESGKAKEAFYTNMSHELRTPLIGILGFAEMIIDENQQKETIEKAKVIHKSGKRLLDTLNMVLDLSKVKNNLEKVYLTSIELTSFINDCFKFFEHTAVQKELTYIFSYDQNRTYFINADTYLLNIIFNNLLNNAIKFTTTGKVEIKLYAENNLATIDIIDTGIGIPEESIGLVFEEFRQVSEGIGRTFGGSGLGLALVKNYTELLKGTISLQSVVGKGSIFTLRFPLISATDKS